MARIWSENATLHGAFASRTGAIASHLLQFVGRRVATSARGVLTLPRRSPASSGVEEREQVGVEPVLVRGRETVRGAGVNLQLGVGDEL